MIYTLAISLSDRANAEGGRVWLLPKGFTLLSYEKILEDENFFSATLVSLKRVAIGCALNIFLLALVSFPLSLPEKKFPEGKFIKWFFLANMLFNGGMIPTYFLMRQYHLFESFWALILPGAFPLGNTILMMNFFRNVPYELNEAAAIDGANPLQMLFKVYVPLSVPSLSCMLLFSFVGHWNSYFDGLIYISDPAKQPLQTYIYSLSVDIDWNSGIASDMLMSLMNTSSKTLNAAKVIVAMIPILLIYPFVQKYFAKGMLIGAVKG